MIPEKPKRIEDYINKPFDYILEEDNVRKYTLPDVLKTDAGQTVTDKSQWEKVRRPELLDAFGHFIYGRIPAAPQKISFKTIQQDDQTFDGKAVYRKIAIELSQDGRQFTFHLQVYTPKSDKPLPVFLLCNNRGRPGHPILPNSSFWPADKLVQQGFAAAMVNNKELADDRNETYRDGVMQLYPQDNQRPDGWGAISAWAYGMSRCVDFLVQDKAIDAGRISVVGHSRGGKIAFWAAANDPRIAMVCANDSGCTGTAIARRKVGETIAEINKGFPYWFNSIYKQYDNREDDLPLDQHMLVALVAPRVICVGSALDDVWADPHGEYLSLVHATPVFELYGLTGMPTTLPVVLDGNTLGGHMAYHIRQGGHGLKDHDWQCYVQAAKHYFK